MIALVFSLALPLVLADTASFVSPYKNVESEGFPTDSSYVNLEKSILKIFNGDAVIKAYSDNELADITIRKQRGLGIVTGEFDEIDSQDVPERMEILFEDDVYIKYIELRSLYAASNDNPAGSKAEIDFYRNGKLIYHDEAYGTGIFKEDDGIWSRNYNKKADKIVFYVDTEAGHELTSFALAKIKIEKEEDSSDLVGSFINKEDWYCTPWSLCINGQQTRDCTDLNSQGTEVFKPTEQRSCIYDSLYYDENGNLISIGTSRESAKIKTGIATGITGQGANTLTGKLTPEILWLLILNVLGIIIIIYLTTRVIAKSKKNNEE